MFKIRYRLDAHVTESLKEFRSDEDFFKEFSIIDGKFEIQMDNYIEGFYVDLDEVDAAEDLRVWAELLSGTVKALETEGEAYFHLWESESIIYLFRKIDSYVHISVKCYAEAGNNYLFFWKVRTKNPLYEGIECETLCDMKVEYSVFVNEINSFISSLREEILGLNENIPRDFKW